MGWRKTLYLALIAVLLTFCPSSTEPSNYVFLSLPKQVIVNSVTYKIDYVDIIASDDPSLMVDMPDGIAYHLKHKIEIDATLSGERQESTLLHEILHAVSYQYRFGDHPLTEWQVLELEKGLYETFQKNHWKIIQTHPPGQN